MQRIVSGKKDDGGLGGVGSGDHRMCEANLLKVQKELEYLKRHGEEQQDMLE